MLSRCDAAILRLRASHKPYKCPSVRDELLTTLRGSKKKKQKAEWKHKFYCLAYTSQNVPVKEAEKDELFSAGLGEKEIEFKNLHATAQEFRDTLYEAFPRLKDGGGYQFLKCLPNTRILEPLSGLVMQSPLKLKQRVGVCRTYIRPLQKDLDTTPFESEDECNVC